MKHILVKQVVFLFTILILFNGCNKNPDNSNGRTIARVLDKYLYEKDLDDIIPSGLVPADSIALAKDFIDKWVRDQLLLNKAELNLTAEEKNVQHQIDNYRSSLLIYIYRQNYINQKLDTIVSDAEIENYFEANAANFLLRQTIIKGTFVQVPVTAPDINRLRQWLRSNDPADIANIEGYCFEHAKRYDYFKDDWIALDEVLVLFPGNVYSPESSIQNNRLIEIRDQDYYYFLAGKDIRLTGELSPLDVVDDDIISIIINKRKIAIITELESSIFNDGQNRGYFNIY